MPDLSDADLVVPGIDGFDDTFLDCYTSCYARMLRRHGLRPEVLGDAWGYWYRHEDTGWPLDRLWMTTRPPHEVISEWYGITEERVQHSDVRDAWRRVETVVAGGGLIAITIDLYHFPGSSFHGSQHYAHRVLISACRGGEAFVLDSGGRQSFTGWLPGENLRQAMAAEELADGRWGYDGRNVTVELPPPHPARRDPGPGRFLASLRANVRRGTPGTDTGPYLTGEAALRAFHADLADYAAATDAIPQDLFMAGVNFLGTVTSMRGLNSLFVTEAARHTALDLKDVADGLQEVARQWNALFHALLFGHRAGRGLSVLRLQALRRIDRIAELEQHVLQLLADRLAHAA